MILILRLGTGLGAAALYLGLLGAVSSGAWALRVCTAQGIHRGEPIR